MMCGHDHVTYFLPHCFELTLEGLEELVSLNYTKARVLTSSSATTSAATPGSCWRRRRPSAATPTSCWKRRRPSAAAPTSCWRRRRNYLKVHKILHECLEALEVQIPGSSAVIPIEALETSGQCHLRMTARDDLGHELVLGVPFLNEGVGPPILCVGLEGPFVPAQVVAGQALLQEDLDVSSRGTRHLFRDFLAAGLQELRQSQQMGLESCPAPINRMYHAPQIARILRVLSKGGRDGV